MTWFPLLLAYWGFAGIFGTLIRTQQTWVWGLFGGLVILPLSAGLPVDWVLRLVGWGAAGGVVWLYLKCPVWLPAWIWGKAFALGYLVILMFLIAIWGILSGFVGVGAAAAAAGVLATFRLSSQQNY